VRPAGRSGGAQAALKALLADIKGQQGEARVRQHLEALGATALHDVRLTSMTGSGTTQIDHLVCLPAAIMVIETKHFAGRLSGHRADRHWRQRLGHETEGRLIYSPLRQNDGHCAAVRALCAPIRLDIMILNRVVLTGPAQPSGDLADCLHTPEALGEEIVRLACQTPILEMPRLWARLTAASGRRP